jgi:hypothetical protein
VGEAVAPSDDGLDAEFRQRKRRRGRDRGGDGSIRGPAWAR